MRISKTLGAAAMASVLAGLGAPAASRAQTVWPDTLLARIEALALLQSLNAELLSHDSATETLRRWCADHQLAADSPIIAERVLGQDKPADPTTLAALNAAPGEVVRYRRVRLACGGRVLSEADNWYLPDRLTPEMNRRLDTTDTPFGVVVKGLGFHRRTVSATLLVKPLADGWDVSAAAQTPGPARPAANDLGGFIVPARVIQHRAILSTAAGTPFSLVVETYTNKVLPDRALSAR